MRSTVWRLGGPGGQLSSTNHFVQVPHNSISRTTEEAGSTKMKRTVLDVQ
jgi:hypothetical protein